jgi:thiosulfate/3-mercaptopyruvate sulfurtransferase
MFCNKIQSSLRSAAFLTHVRRAFSHSKDILINAKEAFELSKQNKSVFIDTRDPTLFNESHIPGARNMNEIFSYLSTSDEKGKKDLLNTFEKLFQKAGLNGNEHIITYEDCLKTRFGASCRGYYLFKLLGHNNVNVLDGGWEAWIKEKYPVTKEATKVTEGKFKAQWNNDVFAAKEDVLKAIGDSKKVIVDVRDFDEWVADSSSPYGKDFTPRKGRIEGAKHVYWRDLMEEKNGLTTLKTPQEVEKICASKGITKDKEVIVYCFKGARASNTFIALKRAGYNVKNYFASWNEWSRDMNLKIDSSKL